MLIEFIISMCRTHSPGEAFRKLEGWVREHRATPKCSTLGRLVPSIGEFFTPLPLFQARRALRGVRLRARVLRLVAWCSCLCRRA